MQIQKAFLFWEDGDDMCAHEVIYMDFGGYVPKRLLNMSMGASTKKGGEGLHKGLVELQKKLNESTDTSTE